MSETLARLREAGQSTGAFGGLGPSECRAVADEIDRLTSALAAANERAERAESHIAELRRYAATLSPGPYQWGIYEEKDRDEFVLKNLSFGSGDTHMVILPKHEGSNIGADPMRPNHAITMFITGNGPKSKDNALGLLRILEILNSTPEPPATGTKE